MPGPAPVGRGPIALSREDWVDRALEKLAAKGIEKVLIALLARELGVTKGSFYWHFDDRSNLLGAMVECWERVGTCDDLAEAEARALLIYALLCGGHLVGAQAQATTREELLQRCLEVLTPAALTSRVQGS